MDFRKQLNKMIEEGLNICDLLVASSCDSLFDFDYTEEEFEKLCDYAEYILLKADGLEIDDITSAISDLIRNEGYKVDDIINMDRYEFISKLGHIKF